VTGKKEPQIAQHELSEIKGLGDAKIGKLKEIGVTTVEGLTYVTRRQLKEIGIKEEARKLQEQALEITGFQMFRKASEILQDRREIKFLTTGSTALNGLFGGGYETQSISEMVGEFGSGKTQLAYTACVTVQLPQSQGGLDSVDCLNPGALIVDTEKTFRPVRISQIAKAHGIDPARALERIIVSTPLNSDQQEDFVAREAAKIIRDNNIRALVVDSLIAHFRNEYLGRENLSERQQRINQHLSNIAHLARTFNLAAIVTNQAIATPDNFFSHVKWIPAGGNIVAHASTLRIGLRKGPDTIRIARLLDSSWLPVGEATFEITESGVTDFESEEKKQTPKEVVQNEPL